MTGLSIYMTAQDTKKKQNKKDKNKNKQKTKTNKQPKIVQTESKYKQKNSEPMSSGRVTYLSIKHDTYQEH